MLAGKTMTLLRTFRLAVGLVLSFLCGLLTLGCNGLSSGSGANGGETPSAAYSIAGTISPAASGSGATVTLGGAAQATTTADSSGNYSFKELSNGSYTVTPSKPGFNFSPSRLDATVKDADATGMDFAVSPANTWSISGAISPAADGSGATVTLSGAADATTTADGSGNYRFDGVANGSYTVIPSKAGVSFNPYSLAAAVSGADVRNLNFSAAAGCSSGHGSADFYVSPSGNDSWSGTLDCPNPQNSDGPFASVARAQQAVRSIIGNRSTPVIVMVRAGAYYLPLSPTSPGTLNFTTADSGTASAPVTWENYPDESPVISGGVPVAGWTHISGSLWQVPLSASVQPFEYLFYNGERRLRSRLQASSGVGYYMKDGSCLSTQTGEVVSIGLCNVGTFLRIASEIAPTGVNAACPQVSNEDGTKSKCLDRFQYDPNDPITTWINLNPPAGNPCNASPSGQYPVGDIELTLFSAWTVDIMRVSCVDTAKHIVYLTGATRGIPNEYDFFGVTAGHRYMLENSKDAFDAAQSAGQTGIWFLDRSTSPWTLSYLANAGEDPNTDTVVIPQLGGEIPGDPATDYVGASLIFATNLSNVTFSGLTFEVDNYIPSSTGFNNDTNEEFPVPQAIDCDSCQNVAFDGITVRHTSGSAILIAGTGGNSGSPAAHDVIQNSAFYDLGSSGVRIGRTPSGGDRPQYVPQDIMVQNNLIQGFSRVFAGGEGIAMGNGHDVTFLHNDISDGYHAGVSICTRGCYSYQWSANGINIITEYNHIWDIMQGLTSDSGALYYNVGSPSGSGYGNRILNNLVHDVSDASVIDEDGIAGSGYGGHGIYLDIQSSDVIVENNVVYRVAASGLVMTQGPAPGHPANTFNNNIVAFARKAMFQEQNPWPQECTNTLRANITHNIFYFDRQINFHAVSGCADSCGMDYNKFQNFQGNLYWRTDGGFATYDKAFYVLTNPPPPNQASTCGQITDQSLYTMFPFSEWQHGTPQVNGKPLPMNEDLTGTASVDPGFGNSGEASDFLLSNAPVTGFSYNETNNTINNAGRTNPVIQAPTVPATFPTYAYSSF